MSRSRSPLRLPPSSSRGPSSAYPRSAAAGRTHFSIVQLFDVVFVTRTPPGLPFDVRVTAIEVTQGTQGRAATRSRSRESDGVRRVFGCPLVADGRPTLVRVFANNAVPGIRLRSRRTCSARTHSGSCPTTRSAQGRRASCCNRGPTAARRRIQPRTSALRSRAAAVHVHPAVDLDRRDEGRGPSRTVRSVRAVLDPAPTPDRAQCVGCETNDELALTGSDLRSRPAASILPFARLHVVSTPDGRIPGEVATKPRDLLRVSQELTPLTLNIPDTTRRRSRLAPTTSSASPTSRTFNRIRE